METNLQSPVKNSFMYGLMTGVGMIIIVLILMLANLYTTPGMQYLIYLPVIAGMVLGTIHFRDKIMTGFIPYGKAFYSSFLIGLFASLLYMIFFYIYVKFIDKGFIDNMMEMTRQQMEARSGGQMTDEQMEQAMSITQRLSSPILLTIIGFLGSLFFSTVIALIVAAFVKKNDNTVQPVS